MTATHGDLYFFVHSSSSQFSASSLIFLHIYWEITSGKEFSLKEQIFKKGKYARVVDSPGLFLSVSVVLVYLVEATVLFVFTAY